LLSVFSSTPNSYNKIASTQLDTNKYERQAMKAVKEHIRFKGFTWQPTASFECTRDTGRGAIGFENF